jgi:hypothetical protein
MKVLLATETRMPGGFVGHRWGNIAITVQPQNFVKLLTHVAIFRKTGAFTSAKHAVFEWHIHCLYSSSSIYVARRHRRENTNI